MMKSKIIGSIIILISSLYVYEHLRFLYLYQDPLILWFYMHPTWYLITNSIIGLIGIFLGIKVYQQKVDILNGSVYAIALLAFGFAVGLFINL